MARYKDGVWILPEPIGTWENAQTAVLMDIRDRLDVLRCPDFCAIPYTLTRILRAAQGRRLSRAERLEENARRHRAALRRRLHRRREAFSGAGR